HRASRPRVLPSFPTRRSSDLVGEDPEVARVQVAGDHVVATEEMAGHVADPRADLEDPLADERPQPAEHPGVVTLGPGEAEERPVDRKSTRLNSSHVSISYAVF